MNPSFTSLFAVVACLALPLLRPRSALVLVAFGSFIGTYAIGSEDGLKILPGPLLAASYCLWLGLKALAHAKARVPTFLGSRRLWPFIAYAVIVTIGAPIVFGDRLSVIRPGAVSEGIREALPLQFSSSSIAQLSYLLFDAILLCVAVRVGRRPGMGIGWTLKIHQRFAVFFATAVSLEAALGLIGLPIDVFSWVMGNSFTEFRPDRYALDAVFGFPIRRAQAIFGEPSYFSVYMTGLFGASLIQARARPSSATLFRLALILLGLLVSFSTTATLGVVLIGVIAAFVPVVAGPVTPEQAHAARRRQRVFMIALVVVAATLVVTVVLSDSVFDYLFGKLSDVEGYEDGNYSSGAERLFWDLVAGQALLDSFGVGVGAGGTRASSFILNFGASFGVVGLLLLFGLVVSLLRTLYKRTSIPQDVDLRATITMWIGWFIALAFSVPDGMSFFYIWIQLGFILALMAPRDMPSGQRLFMGPHGTKLEDLRQR